jgi:hypothetical protein
LPAEVPARGLSSREIRLAYPGRWRTEEDARHFVRDNGLGAAGVAVTQVGDVWRIVIDSYRAAMLVPWLRTQFPGILWAVSWTPT